MTTKAEKVNKLQKEINTNKDKLRRLKERLQEQKTKLFKSQFDYESGWLMSLSASDAIENITREILEVKKEMAGAVEKLDQIEPLTEAEFEAREAAEQARREAQEQARREAQEQARREAEEQARREAEQRARREAEQRARREAEEQARREAEQRARREAQEQAQREAQTKALLASKTPADVLNETHDLDSALRHAASVSHIQALQPREVLGWLSQARMATSAAQQMQWMGPVNNALRDYNNASTRKSRFGW